MMMVKCRARLLSGEPGYGHVFGRGLALRIFLTVCDLRDAAYELVVEIQRHGCRSQKYVPSMSPLSNK